MTSQIGSNREDPRPGPTGWAEHEITALDALVGSLAANRAAINALQALDAAMLTAALALAEERAATRGGSADLEIREISAEIGAALRVSDRTVQRQLSDAHTLSTRFAATHRAQSEGRISRAHADVIMDAGVRIADDAARASFETEILVHAERESAARLRPIAKLLAERALPESIDERHARARIERNVILRDLPDAMAAITVTGPSTQIHGIHDRVSQMATIVSADNKKEAAEARAAVRTRVAAERANAREVDGEVVEGVDAAPEFVPDTRTLDQLRADLFIDLVLTGAPSGHGPIHILESIRAQVLVQVPVLTLLGSGDEQGLLEGSGPIDAETARAITGAARGWDRVLTHPITGTVLAIDRYWPNEDLRRLLRARDQHCRFPGCRLPARYCDDDHLIDAAQGGPTDADNLAGECRRHHVLKHQTAWTVEHVGGGVLHWKSPTGRVYPDRPISSVTFRPSGDPPPF
jgi:hypothetical protein